MRPIDADAVLDFLDVGHLRPPTEICFSELMMKNIIDIQPTVDAVPVVRCRDCIFHKEKRCTVWRERAVIVECYTDDDGYCYKGLRKEE